MWPHTLILSIVVGISKLPGSVSNNDGDSLDTDSNHDSDNSDKDRLQWDDMTNPDAEALKAKFDCHKGQITKAGNKIKELVEEDNVDDPNLQNAKLQTWKDRLLKKWELLEEILRRVRRNRNRSNPTSCLYDKRGSLRGYFHGGNGASCSL